MLILVIAKTIAKLLRNATARKYILETMALKQAILRLHTVSV